MPANAVEIGLSPKALAALLGRSAAEIAAWTAGQRARTGRECVVSGQRGSFPAGLAFGSRRELAAFLDAWREFARPQPSTAILERTRIEKAAEDAGFDLTPAQEGSWLVFASSAFAHRLGVRAPGAEAYRVGLSQAGWGTKAAGDCASALEGGAAPRAAVTEVTDYDILHALLRRAGRIAHLLAGEAAGEFACASAALPSATEVERLAIQASGRTSSAIPSMCRAKLSPAYPDRLEICDEDKTGHSFRKAAYNRPHLSGSCLHAPKHGTSLPTRPMALTRLSFSA